MTFDYATAARRAGMPPDDLERLVRVIRAEFPGDAMMAELHILRAILSVERGDISLEDILHPKAAA